MTIWTKESEWGQYVMEWPITKGNIRSLQEKRKAPFRHVLRVQNSICKHDKLKCLDWKLVINQITHFVQVIMEYMSLIN